LISLGFSGPFNEKNSLNYRYLSAISRASCMAKVDYEKELAIACSPLEWASAVGLPVEKDQAD
jgi:hypothetical protein